MLSFSSFLRNPGQLWFNTLTTRYIAQHSETAFKIELFLLSEDQHDQIRFKRRVNIGFLGTTAWLPRAEDVIIWKLRWAVRANRQKDREDAFMVLATQYGHLDLDHVRYWCAQHGTLPLLEQMLRTIAESEQE